MNADDFKDAKVALSDQVVYQEFTDETVALNLETGQYHGLNSTALAMLEAVTSAATVSEAIPGLCAQFGVGADVIEPDLLRLCAELHERGFLTVG